MASESKFGGFVRELSESNAGHDPVTVGPTLLAPESINDLTALPNLQNQVMAEIIKNINVFDTRIIALTLDSLLALGLHRPELSGQETYITGYFTTLETAVSLLTNAQLSGFWSYLESRAGQVAQLAQGVHSITLLRICRSVINRLNRVLDSELIGRVLQYLAVCKGFPHPSRLNRRSKKNPAIPSHEVSLLGKPGSLGLTPFKALETMADLNILGGPADVTHFAHDLVAKFKQWYTKSRSGTPQLPTFDLQWSELTSESLDILLLQATFALSGYLAELEEPHAGVAKALEDVQAFRTKEDTKALQKKLLETELLWTQWKSEQQCRPLEANPITISEPKDTTPVTPKIDLLAPLTGTIGNQELTRLMAAEFSPSKFVVDNDHTATINDLEQSLTTASKPDREITVFKIMRLQDWQSSIDRFAKQPVVEHADVTQQEEALQQKLRAASEGPPTPVKRPSSPSTEPLPKRSRLSYDDEGRRSYASERTVRPPAGDSGPLPY